MKIQLLDSLKNAKNTDIVVYLRPWDTLQKIGNIFLPEAMSDDIASHLKQKKDTKKKKKSSLQTYFLGDKNYTTLRVLCDFSEKSSQSIEFLGKEFPNFPENIVVMTPHEEAIDMLMRVCELSRYQFQKYLSNKTKKSTEYVVPKKLHKSLKSTIELIENIMLARDLGETPACDLTPKAFAKLVSDTKFSHVKTKVLNYTDIQEQWLGLIEAVGKGSKNTPRVVILEYIVDKKQPIHSIVGKGVTFDTGGNQIKPENYMYDMKGDMGGAAVTFALMKEIDRRAPKKNFVAILMLAENVVSSNAYKPSDIITGYTGKTVEVIHTDAEGRLVLADGMSYLSKHYTPETMMTIATLTGACIVGLGYRHAGIMGTNTDFIRAVVEYGHTHSEQYIELPFADYMLEKTTSKIADYKNLERSVHAGSSMGAAFLSNFCENDEKYTHIDIAGVYINEADPYGKMPKGMTGFGVESLSEMLCDTDTPWL